MSYTLDYLKKLIQKAILYYTLKIKLIFAGPIKILRNS